MTERYEDVRLAPDPGRSEELRRRLHAHMTSSAPSRVAEIDEEVVVSQNPIRHRSRRSIYLAAAAVVVITGGVIGIALATADPGSDGDPGNTPTLTAPPVTAPATTPTPTQPASTQPATNAPAITTTVAPTVALTDAVIADAALLYPSEYARGATEEPGAMTYEMTFDVDVASELENCSPYLDAIAAADAAPESSRNFGLLPDTQGQYTVVFPDEQVASDWFDVVTDDAFLANCAADLFEGQFAVGKWLPVGPVDRAVPPLDLDGDDVSVGIGRYDFDRADGSAVHTESLEAMVRVDRMVFQIDAVYPRLTTVESFEAMVARAVERAQAALRGEILPEASVPDLPPLTDAEIADASMLTGDEFHPGFVVNEARTDAIRLDAGVAATIPACGPYVETIATLGAATARTRWFTSENGPHDYSQYTIVFPDEQAANRAFDMLDDDAFVTDCAIPTQTQQGSDVPVTGTTTGPILTSVVGDESTSRVTGDGDVEFRFRTDRTVIVLTGGDPSVQTPAQFLTTATQAAQKLRLAYQGIVLPQ
jgi:hypothetical protein